jgi:hypothetical protein
LGCSHHTVKHYVAAGGVVPFKAPKRAKALDGHEDWLRERFLRHRSRPKWSPLSRSLSTKAGQVQVAVLVVGGEPFSNVWLSTAVAVTCGAFGSLEHSKRGDLRP